MSSYSASGKSLRSRPSYVNLPWVTPRKLICDAGVTFTEQTLNQKCEDGVRIMPGTMLQRHVSKAQLRNPAESGIRVAKTLWHKLVGTSNLETSALCIKGVNLRKKSEICGRSLYLCGLNVLFAAYHRHKLWWRFQTPSLSKKLSYWRFKISSNSKIFGHLCTLG